MRIYSKTEAKEKIQELVQKYERAKESRLISKDSEEETKEDFVLPLFQALGWEISDKKEVTAEESQSGGRVDYGFYLDDRLKFYVEAKPLRSDLNREEFANQAIRYSWNKGATWAILTDFESLKVFNAQVIDRSLADKLFYEIPYSQYLERFEQLWLLSKEAFGANLLDKDAEAHGKKLQRISVTNKLYKDLNECREILTHDLGQWNKNVDKDLLDEGVQKLLDRLIFLRVAEDRGIEPQTLIPLIRDWKNKGGKEHLYESMIKKFRELDKIYNSNLFSEHPFEKWEEYSGATERVIKILYGKKGYYEYDFKAMPADVLGSVYENYLGYRLAKSKKGLSVSKDAKKRKEHGIYYTPDFIVDYIVRNTLKPVLDNCISIEDLKRIKVLDPACGSGSFLTKALEVINDKYKEFGNTGGVFTKLTILLENIYGVDLDPQAVEITRLNLLISALDERMELPSLDKNIKNGNSLISGSDQELEKYFGKNFRDKKPFNWQEEFPEVFKQGGFDVIIGNPPYINAMQLKEVASIEKTFWKEKFETAKGTYDIYILFFEQSLKICKQNGYVGFITPNKYLSSPYGESLRALVTNNFTLERVLDLSRQKVFNSPSVYPIVTIIKNAQPKSHYQFSVVKTSGNDLGHKSVFKVNSNLLRIIPNYNWGIISSNNIQIIEKIFGKSTQLSNIAEVNATSTAAESDEFTKYINEKEIGLPIINSGTIDRYATTYERIFFKNKGNKFKEPYLDISKINDRRRKLYTSPKIIIAKLALRIEGFLDGGKYASINTNCVYSPIKNYSLEYITGVLNSKLISFIYSQIFSGLKMGGGYYQFQAPQLRILPVPQVSSEDQNIISNLVFRMVKLYEELDILTENSNKWNLIKSEIEKVDKKIDEEVYKLYGLTPEEIEIVENEK